MFPEKIMGFRTPISFPFSNGNTPLFLRDRRVNPFDHLKVGGPKNWIGPTNQPTGTVLGGHCANQINSKIRSSAPSNGNQTGLALAGNVNEKTPWKPLTFHYTVVG